MRWSPLTLERSALVRRLAALPSTTRLWAWCAGVAWLAAAGRLDGRRATAAWWLRARLEARFPRVHWRFDEPHIKSRGVATASGPYGYLSLVMSQLEHHLDATELEDVRELLVLPLPHNPHPLFREVDLMSTDERLRPLVTRVLRTPMRDLSLSTLASARSRNMVGRWQ